VNERASAAGSLRGKADDEDNKSCAHQGRELPKARERERGVAVRSAWSSSDTEVLLEHASLCDATNMPDRAEKTRVLRVGPDASRAARTKAKSGAAATDMDLTQTRFDLELPSISSSGCPAVSSERRSCTTLRCSTFTTSSTHDEPRAWETREGEGERGVRIGAVGGELGA